MLYLFAAIGIVAIAVLLWRAFAPARVHAGTTRPRSIAPDDDPDFLRSLGEQNRRPDNDDEA